MAKYCGAIGYGVQTDGGNGIWEERIVEKPAVGDLMQNNRRWQGREEMHDDLMINNKVSIVMDAWASAHFFDIRYAVWRGAHWKVTNVEVQHPRLILTLGEVHHGPTDGSSEELGRLHDAGGV